MLILWKSACKTLDVAVHQSLDFNTDAIISQNIFLGMLIKNE